LGISMTVLGNVGVTVATARRRNDGRPRERANDADVSTTAAPPSEVAQMSSRRSGSATTGDAATSSPVTALRYRARGLARPWRAFLTLTAAKSSTVAP
jgi:hypothetical protein